MVEQLRTDMEGLLLELDNLSRRNDELMTAKDSDLSIIRDLDQQLKEYKRKYEQAKTELRSVKGRLHPDLLAKYTNKFNQLLLNYSFLHLNSRRQMIYCQCRQTEGFLTSISLPSSQQSTASSQLVARMPRLAY